MAFAHTSCDFHSERHISAGVAKVLKKKFGRALKTNCVNEYWACREPPNGAAVYVLITKTQYFHKPELQYYDTTFKSLAEQFKKGGFKKLVFSPLWCVRNNVPLSPWVKSLISQHFKNVLEQLLMAKLIMKIPAGNLEVDYPILIWWRNRKELYPLRNLFHCLQCIHFHPFHLFNKNKRDNTEQPPFMSLLA